MTPKQRLLADIERWLTYFLTEEIASGADKAELKDAIAGFIKEEVSKYDIRDLPRLADPMDRAVTLFLQHLRSKGLAERFKGLWH